MTLITTATESSNDSQVVTTKAFEVDVAGVADAPVVSATDAVGESNTAIALDIQSNLTDIDGSETLSVVVSGMPEDATLSSGTRNADGSWTVAKADLPALAVTAADGFVGDMNLNIEAVATEENGDVATESTTLKVQVNEAATPRAAAAAAVISVDDETSASDDAATESDDDSHAASSTSSEPVETEEVDSNPATQEAIVDAMQNNDVPASESNWTEDIDSAGKTEEPRVTAEADPLSDEALVAEQANADSSADPLAADEATVTDDQTSLDDTLTVVDV